jgi:hypothetical protein
MFSPYAAVSKPTAAITTFQVTVLLYNHFKSGARTSINCVSGVEVSHAPRMAARTLSQRFGTLI